MLDDVRKPAAAPTREESEWVEKSTVGMMVRAVALAGVALCVGVAASFLVERTDLAHGMVAAAEK